MKPRDLEGDSRRWRDLLASLSTPRARLDRLDGLVVVVVVVVQMETHYVYLCPRVSSGMASTTTANAITSTTTYYYHYYH
ncbi:hypothetical protein E2C01_014238 [Portunus trituberculatus]|uniref:Uncharacterized protein n=1 Tax=Portunus trituberculatus TaxID=210409 RepID=A0A5B7DJL4_PORTR|nr:hypothetical protein [Portunus trituberculatus]